MPIGSKGPSLLRSIRPYYTIGLTIKDEDFASKIINLTFINTTSFAYPLFIIDFSIDAKDYFTKKLYGQEDCSLVINVLDESLNIIEQFKTELLIIKVETNMSMKIDNMENEVYNKDMVTINCVPKKAYRTMNKTINKVFEPYASSINKIQSITDMISSGNIEGILTNLSNIQNLIQNGNYFEVLQTVFGSSSPINTILNAIGPNLENINIHQFLQNFFLQATPIQVFQDNFNSISTYLENTARNFPELAEQSLQDFLQNTASSLTSGNVTTTLQSISNIGNVVNQIASGDVIGALQQVGIDIGGMMNSFNSLTGTFRNTAAAIKNPSEAITQVFKSFLNDTDSNMLLSNICKDSVKQMIIPPMTFFNSIKYVNDYYGLFNGPFFAQFRIDKDQFCMWDLSKVIEQKEEFRITFMGMGQEHNEFINIMPTGGSYRYFCVDPIQVVNSGNSKAMIHGTQKIVIGKTISKFCEIINTGIEKAKDKGGVSEDNKDIAYNKQLKERKIVVSKPSNPSNSYNSFITSEINNNFSNSFLIICKLKSEKMKLIPLMRIGSPFLLEPTVTEYLQLQGKYINVATIIELSKENSQSFFCTALVYGSRSNTEFAQIPQI